MEDPSTAAFFNEGEIMQIMKNQPNASDSIRSVSQDSDQRFNFQQPVAVVWDEGSQKQWYIGFIISESPDTVIIDHLERKSKDCHDTWQRPPVDDTQTANIVQIIPCPVQGDWEFSSRIPHYVLENSLSIAQKFFEHWK